jgi:branched-chain amino acid transport system substrate-binding protein
MTQFSLTSPHPARKALRAVAAVSFALVLGVAHAKTIKIGLPVPLTGPYGAEAKDQVRNAELAVKESNDAGGLNGRKAELLVRDDKLHPAVVVEAAIELPIEI